MYIANTDVPVELTRRILGSAIAVHRELGPGLLESTYRACLIKQLQADGMDVKTEVSTILPQ
jgi:GxxExxY protein